MNQLRSQELLENETMFMLSPKGNKRKSSSSNYRQRKNSQGQQPSSKTNNNQVLPTPGSKNTNPDLHMHIQDYVPHLTVQQVVKIPQQRMLNKTTTNLSPPRSNQQLQASTPNIIETPFDQACSNFRKT